MRNALWLFIAAIVILVVFLPSYTRLQDLNVRNDDYEKQLVALQQKNSQLRRERELLEKDPVYLEKVAREKMGLIRDGEVVYRLTPVDINAPQSVPPPVVSKPVMMNQESLGE